MFQARPLVQEAEEKTVVKDQQPDQVEEVFPVGCPAVIAAGSRECSYLSLTVPLREELCR